MENPIEKNAENDTGAIAIAIGSASTFQTILDSDR